ncbi:MAG: hypothetical protein LUC18_00920 [Porphyromonadaceae bacterium]|nr:hypothetical protein [Porphyromonadaceae bacterium]
MSTKKIPHLPKEILIEKINAYFESEKPTIPGIDNTLFRDYALRIASEFIPEWCDTEHCTVDLPQGGFYGIPGMFYYKRELSGAGHREGAAARASDLCHFAKQLLLAFPDDADIKVLTQALNLVECTTEEILLDISEKRAAKARRKFHIYRIVALTDPHHSHLHYHGEKVLRYAGATPVEWIHDDNGGYGYTRQEAMALLAGWARESGIEFRRGSTSFTDDVMTYYLDRYKYFETESK